MKANNLNGEYCQSCAAILDDVQRNHRRVIVLDSQCAAVFHQSGDAARLDDQIRGDKPAQPDKFPSHAPKELEPVEIEDPIKPKSVEKPRKRK